MAEKENKPRTKDLMRGNADEGKMVSYSWRKKIKGREDMMKYLKTAERYWYSDDWFGSEKRKNPA